MSQQFFGTIACVKCKNGITFNASLTGGDWVDGFGGCRLPTGWEVELHLTGPEFNRCPNCLEVLTDAEMDTMQDAAAMSADEAREW